MRTVTVRWPDEVTTRWNALVDRISEAIKADNERKLKSARQHEILLEERNKLESENRRLVIEVEELYKSVGRRDKTDFELLDRQKRQDLLRLIAQIIVLLTVTWFSIVAYQQFREYQQTSFAHQLQLQELILKGQEESRSQLPPSPEQPPSTNQQTQSPNRAPLPKQQVQSPNQPPSPKQQKSPNQPPTTK